MGECESCAQIKALENTVKGFVSNADQQFQRLNRESADYEKRISSLESGSAVSEERFRQVFEKLDDIIHILNENRGRLPTLIWAAAGMVLGGVFVWIFTEILQKFVM